jgi:hypothetical protein
MCCRKWIQSDNNHGDNKMLKPLTILSVSTVALLASTSAFSHVICAPDSPQGRAIGHTHNQAYTVPRIVQQPAAHNPNQARYLQQQRARQQKALANQQRINQQRRAQALQKQQQIAAQKARQIQLQRLAAQRAQQARQQAAQARARQAKLQAQQAARYVRPAAPVKQVVRYTAPVVQQQYVQPTYVQPVVYYQAPAPVVYQAPVYYAPRTTYTPTNSYVSVSVGGGNGGDHGSRSSFHRVSKPVKQVHTKHYPRQKAVVQHLQAKYQQAKHQQAKQYNHAGKSYGNYKVGGNGGERSHSGHRQAKRQQAAHHMVWKGQQQSKHGQSHGKHSQHSYDKK